MSVSNQTNKVSITGNGVTTAFSFSFPIFTVDQIVVYKIDSDGNVTTLSYGTHYTVSINSSSEGGTVTLTSGSVLPSGYTGLIKRVVGYTQSVSLPNEGALPAKQIENQLDLMSMMIIQVKEITDRCIQLDPTSTLSGITLPTPEDGKVLVWSGTDGTIINGENDAAAASASASAAAASAAAALVSQGAASTSATAAAASAVAAAASAASISVPSATGKSLQILREKVGENGLEFVALSAYDQIIALVSKILKTAKGADVASGSSISLGDDGNLFKITGTTTINNITAKTAGTFAALYFGSAVTLSVSGNLKLAGGVAFSAAADDAIILFSDGTNWREVGRSTSQASTASRIQIFTASGTFVAPSGVTKVYLSMVGGGGGGGAKTSGVGGGGASGRWVINRPYTVIPGNSYTVTIGAGGAGKGTSSGAATGGTGGSTVFDALTMTGGAGGTSGGAGGTGTGLDGIASVSTAGPEGQSSSGGGTTGGGSGGSTPFGKGGTSAADVNGSATAPSANTGAGGGGNGQNGTDANADGASGVCIVMY